MKVARRPDADEVLARHREEERRARRGKLTIFFGAAPGVGKTYAMLEAARSERDLRRDVLLGVVETHGRYDTAALTIGLEILPRRKVEHRGILLEELDLEAAIARRPGVVLVDELAHTNAPGGRHAKRWQDVDDLLEEGIDVYTTLNVQHLESLNDVVAQITGVVVRETVPDKLVDEADEIRLVDLPPAELLERLAEGKIYVPDQAERAASGFFKLGTLTALRELALRRTAERVDEQVQRQRRAEGVEHAWPVAERILVCVSASPESARLVRAARRMAASLRAQWIAAYVETAATARVRPADHERVAQNLRLAEQLGADTVRLAGENTAREIIDFARRRNVTQIVVGKPTHARWRDLFRQSFLDELVRATPDIDVHVITGEGARSGEARGARPPAALDFGGYGASVVAVAVTTLLAWFLFGRSELADVVMVFLLGVIFISMRFGYGPSIATSILSVLAFDLIFVPPYGSFDVSDLRHIVTFGVMFLVGFVISSLTKRIRDQAESARQRERRTSRLYAMSRELADTSSSEDVRRITARHLAAAFDATAIVLLRGDDGALLHDNVDPRDAAVADWVLKNGKPAGAGTDTLASSAQRFMPLRGARQDVGVLALRPSMPTVFSADPEQRRLLETFASQIATALERVRFAEEARRAEVEVETERLRSSLLSSVSHDLRTPLGVIVGATSTLMQDDATLGAEARQELVATAHEEADHLNRLVGNLLDMTRLTAGAIQPRKEWHPLDEIVGVVIRRLEERLRGRRVDVHLPDDLPPVPLDDVLVEQALSNLLDNALKYTPEGSPIEIDARAHDDVVEVEVTDRGPGVPAASRDAIFGKFVRLERERAGGGAGLGLAICRGFIEAHGGRIWVDDRPGGGARFHFTLPVDGEPPVVPT